MNLAIGFFPSPPELHSLRLRECDNLQTCPRRRRASVSLRPVSCFASSSSASSPSQEGAAATATVPSPLRRPQKPSRDLAGFKPPPPTAPDTAKDLEKDLPFQYWYSYSDLPPGIPKRRSKNPLSTLTAEELESRYCLDKGGTGGNSNGHGSLWEAVLAVESESNLDTPKVCKRGRGGNNVDGGLREIENKDENTPLTKGENKRLILSCHGTSRQINVGWQGWNPNYVALVHTYWKNSRVCKIKCKGAITLDMDSFCKLLEVETGGMVFHRVGGSVYLFRGRNYDYWKDRQRLLVRFPRIKIRFPKKLPVPFNLTKEDIKALRARGQEFPALCKPGKHGVYLTLLDDVRKEFETKDLVRVNCQGFYSRNMKILGSQLQALVPCELISYEFEHILMWRRKDGNPPNEQVTVNLLEESCLVPKALS